MPAWISVVVFALAVARVTRFITADKLSESIRGRIVLALWLRRAHGDRELVRLQRSNQAEPPLLAYLIECPWCVSIYVAAVAAPLCWWWGDTPYALIPALWLAFSHVTGLLAKIEG
jgi:hypothetical protein